MYRGQVKEAQQRNFVELQEYLRLRDIFGLPKERQTIFPFTDNISGLKSGMEPEVENK
jgi:hypothetical protein